MGNAGGALAHRDDGPSDFELVRRVRRGDDRAFEQLYERYQRRIAAYVLGMVKDHGRAEDITQEVFVAALRRMRATERPIAFKPWIYEIARNACIDAYRRTRRGEEVSYDADERLSPADHGRLVAAGPEPPAAVAAKQELDTMLGAFGGLSEAHHQILVMRELEGMSYAAIGERMGMSRAGVESTLFRARKRLSEEYEELASGARCVRVQGIVEAKAGATLGVRDAQRLARHVAHCQPCRRLALQAGFDVPARRGLAGRIAAWLPLPGFLRFGGWGVQRLADALEPGWGKLAAGAAALLLAGAGAETVIQQAGGEPPRRDAMTAAQGDRQGPSDDPKRLTAAVAPPVGGPDARPSVREPGTGGRDGDAGTAPATATGAACCARRPRRRRRGRPQRARRRAAGRRRRRRREHGRAAAAAARRAAGAATPTAPAAARARMGGCGGGGGGGGGSDPAQPVRDVVDRVDQTVQNTTQTVQNTTQNVTNTVDNTVQNVQQVVEEPENLVPNTTETVDQVVEDVGTTAGGAVDDVTNTVGGLLQP